MAGVPDKDKGTPVTQAGILSPIIKQAAPAVIQNAVSVAHRPPPSLSGRLTHAPALTAHRPPASRGVRVVQDPLYVLGETEANLSAIVTQNATLVAWKTGVTDQKRQRAWTFDFDGHTFYVLDLGQEGTWLYDFTTQVWTTFETPGFGSWNFINGFSWESNRMTVGGDAIYPVVYSLDPTSHYDDGWRPVEYRVTAGISSSDRNGKAVDSIRLNVASGYTVDPNPIINLRFSDDNGATWSKYYPFNLTLGDYSQRVEWNSLGQIQIPGRVFEFSDQGGLVRIDAAEVQLDSQP